VARQGSGLGVGVSILLVVAAAAAGFAAFGPPRMPDWAEPYVEAASRNVAALRGTVARSVADHLPPLGLTRESDKGAAAAQQASVDRNASQEQEAHVPAFEERRRGREVAALPPQAREIDPIAAAGAAQPATARTIPPEATRPEVPAASVKASPGSAPPGARAPLAPSVPPADARDVALAEARSLFESNNIEAAREKLRGFAPEKNADIAWALARTYDPRHIRSVGGQAEAADLAEAEKWYRRWYALGVEAGLVSQNFRIERLIEAMRRQ
jgi:hypothetical protein